MKNKKALLFDLDGTLIDSVPDLALSINEMLEALEKETFSVDTIRAWVGNGADILVKRALTGSRDIDETLDPTLVSKALAIFLNAYTQNLCVDTVTYDNVHATLEVLAKAGFRMAIVTNKPIAFVAPLLDTLALSDFFEFLVGGDSLSKRKPSPEQLLHVCDHFDVGVEDCVMIGDSKNDILAAQAAGMQSIAVNYGYNYDEDIKEHHPDFVVDDFAEILAILDRSLAYDQPSKKEAKIAVVGGGIAGSTIALYLSELGQKVSLFEKGPSLVNGPPMCHLHAGGNLYREISDHQCVALLKESIDLVRFYPEAVDYRPTVIAVPTDDEGKPEDLYTRLKMLQGEYEALITLDKANKVLGESADYFKLYDRSEVEQLKAKKAVDNPTLMDEWMVPVAKNIDLDKVQFPLIMVQEYGLNAFRLAASVTLRLEAIVNCELHFDHEVVDVKKCEGKEGYLIRSKHQDNEQEQRFDFLINAAGFNSGMIDDFLGFHRERFVEFKAAYVSRWEACTTTWPEMVFYGKRGTPKGMAQFTPYPEGHFQLHGMTKSITLFEEGLVKSSRQSAQPQLHPKLLNKIQKNWTLAESKERSLEAIEHLARFIPAFKQATVVSKPLYGAQQIPGIDETLRAAEVSFADECYARCEIVKASSVLSMADAITKRLIALGFIKKQMYGKRDFSQTKKISETQISDVAHALCEKREYPSSLAKRIKKGR